MQTSRTVRVCVCVNVIDVISTMHECCGGVNGIFIHFRFYSQGYRSIDIVILISLTRSDRMEEINTFFFRCRFECIIYVFRCNRSSHFVMT